MTKQEYQSTKAIIWTHNKLGNTDRLIELLRNDAEYIASLEAENAALKKRVRKLEAELRLLKKNGAT